MPSASLVERIRRFVKRELDPERESADEALVQGPADDIQKVLHRIRLAARTNTLLWLKYRGEKSSRGEWRHVEPYSFRYRAKHGGSPLLFGYCHLHEGIHAFYLSRIEDVTNTDRPFSPRWPVEIA